MSNRDRSWRRPGVLAGGLLALLAALVLASDVRAKETTPDEAERKALQKALDKALKIEESLLGSVRKVRRNSVSVLHKRFNKARPEDPARMVGVGSGALVKHGGKVWIVTNVHVIQGADELDVVTHDGVVHPVEEVDSIPNYDIALLRFRKKQRAYKGVTLKKSASDEKNLAEGAWVIATGNPFFLAVDGRSVTTLGVVSGLERYLAGKFNYAGAIQHDAEVNPGNSGGPLWNLKGDLLGINGMIVMGQRMPGAGPSNTGASFSLPVHQVERFMKLLAGKKDAQAGYLGIDTETFKDKKGRTAGARIRRVHRNSPVMAERGDDRPREGDVIVRITLGGSGTKVFTAKDLNTELSLYPADTRVTIRFKRGRKSFTWKGRLGGR